MNTSIGSFPAQKNQLSIEHKYGLILCDHINIGMRKQIAPERIFNYSKWFVETFIINQFIFEEKVIFPLLEINDVHIKKILAEHQKIKRLINKPSNLIKAINLLEEVLEQHIRFENRYIFNEINLNIDDYFGYGTSQQYTATNKEKQIEWTDKFWEEAI